MGAVKIRSEVDQYLDQVDEPFLRVVHAMLGAYVRERTLPPPPWAKQQTVAERNQTLLDADREIERGEFVTLEQLKREAEEW